MLQVFAFPHSHSVSNERTGGRASRPPKIPASLIALGIEFGQRRRTAAYRGQGDGFFGIGYRLGHDAIRAIG
jgi:hypothetical protein